jgi:CRISPR-associated endonuclease Cas1
MKYCLSQNIPITFLSSRGQYYGRLENPQYAQTQLHAKQFAHANDAAFQLGMAKTIVHTKVNNSRALLLGVKRNRRSNVASEVTYVAGVLRDTMDKLSGCNTLEALYGLEGQAAKYYFQAYASLFKDSMGFDGRNKQPPQDPVNSLLSFGYTLLFYNIYSLLRVNGLNPYVGNLHKMRDYSPSLASDLMEEFRAPIIDRLVLTLVNRRIIKEENFSYPNQPDTPCLLSAHARRMFVHQFEKKMRTQTTHPHTGYAVDWRRCIQLQIQQYKRCLNNDELTYQGMTIR